MHVVCAAKHSISSELHYITLVLQEYMVTSPEVQGDLKSMFPDSKWLCQVELWLPSP